MARGPIDGTGAAKAGKKRPCVINGRSSRLGRHAGTGGCRARTHPDLLPVPAGAELAPAVAALLRHVAKYRLLQMRA
jgi:hypothetical protein